MVNPNVVATRLAKLREYVGYLKTLRKRSFGESGFIPKPFSRKIAPMGGFRNILVHDYLKVDPRKVYVALQGHLADIERFARLMARTLR